VARDGAEDDPVLLSSLPSFDWSAWNTEVAALRAVKWRHQSELRAAEAALAASGSVQGNGARHGAGGAVACTVGDGLLPEGQRNDGLMRLGGGVRAQPLLACVVRAPQVFAFVLDHARWRPSVNSTTKSG